MEGFFLVGDDDDDDDGDLAGGREQVLEDNPQRLYF